MTFSQAIRFSVLRELVYARQAQHVNDPNKQFFHLQNAHVLGQESTYWHTYVHMLMLRWAWCNRVLPEFTGQLVRILGAASKTALGWVPRGNTGGANVSPFKVMPIPANYAQTIANAKKRVATWEQ